MLTLREFLECSRKYIAGIYDDETQANLRKWCSDNGFDLTKSYSGKEQSPDDFKFHTTIFYSDTMHNLANGSFELETPFKVRPFAFDLLGMEKNVPVIKIDGHGLYKQRDYFDQTFNMRDSWDFYLPHVSLSYVKSSDYDMSKLKLPKFPMIINRIDIEDIDE